MTVRRDNNTFDADETGSWSPSRRNWLQTLGLAGATSLAGCSGGGGGGNGTTTTTTQKDLGEGNSSESNKVDSIPEVGGTFKDAIGQGVSTLNWVYNTEDTADGIIGLMMDGSYSFKPGQELFPLWMDLSSDGNRVWTAKLRENLRWSDPYGKMTAEDWVYAIKNLHQTEWSGTAASSNWYKDGEPITVEKTGKYTFDIKLKNADPLFPKRPTLWGAYTAPKKLLKPYVDNKDVKGLKKDKKLNTFAFAGNLGPYKFEKWERKKKAVATRNEDYYLREADDVPKRFTKAPYFDKYIYNILLESSSRLSALKTGQIDTAGVPPNKAPQFKKKKGLYLNVTPQPYMVKIAYNMRANGWEPFRKRGVRQALGCAVNKKALVQGVYRGYGSPAYTWQPKWSKWYDGSKVTKYGTGDLYGPEVTRKKMRKALKGTGYKYQGDKLVNSSGEQVSLNLYFSSGQQEEKSTAQFVAQQFKKNAGIKVNIQGIPGPQFDTKYVKNSLPNGEPTYNAGDRDKAVSQKAWDMSLVYGLNTYPMTPGTNKAFFPKDGSFNYYGYNSSKYDFGKLFNQISNAKTVKKRKKLYAEIFGKISKDQPMGMLLLNSDIYGYQEGIEGPTESFYSGWDYQSWYRQ